MPHTRSSLQPDHLLQTPDTFVRAPMPGMTSATAIIHAAPAMGAKFTQYTVELERGGSFETTPSQSFLYVLDGEIAAGADRQRLKPPEFLYLPPDNVRRISANEPARVLVIEKPFVPIDQYGPSALLRQ